MTTDDFLIRDHRGLSVLITEDNGFTRDLLNKILVSFGMPHVTHATSGEDALRKLHNDLFDLVICDIVMEGMNGIQFVKSVRANATPRVNRVPIIMLTAHADEKLVMAALKAGANGYLVKPLIPKRLVALVAKLCNSTVPTLRRLDATAQPAESPASPPSIEATPA